MFDVEERLMTPIKTLLSHFDTKGRSFYIDIYEIERQVLSLSTGHTVVYCPYVRNPDTDVAVLGMLEQVESPRAWGDDGVENFVHYDDSLKTDYKRLVVAKELIHILDPRCYLTNTPIEVSDLMASLAVPSAVKELGTHSFHDLNTVVVLAVGLFIPLTLRAEMIDAFKRGALTVGMIAERVEIPPSYVVAVMSDWWPASFMQCVDKFEREIEALGCEDDEAI